MIQILAIKPELRNFKGISYYKYKNGSLNNTILYIHGLGCNKEFFSGHLELYNLSGYSWLVPDLIGHGLSFKTQSLVSYTMKYQAEQILQLLLHEEIKDIIVISHSMGSPIAYFLIDELIELAKIKNNFPIKVVLYISVEGNTDANDTFFSGQIIAHSWKDFLFSGYSEIKRTNESNKPGYYETLKDCDAWDLYASSLDLINVSKSEITIPFLQKIIKNNPVKILYGENNKGLFTSESLLAKYFPIQYIPNSGHNMLIDNPKGFWEIISNLVKEYF